MSEAEAYEVGMSLSADARRRLAIRLLESIEATDQEAIDEAWTSEISSRVDDILNGRVQTVPGGEVFARIAGHLDAREAARKA